MGDVFDQNRKLADFLVGKNGGERYLPRIAEAKNQAFNLSNLKTNALWGSVSTSCATFHCS